MEIKRDIHLKRLVASRHNGLIKVITGIRRSGKSYLLRVLFRNFLIGEGIKENHIIEVDLEDRRNRKYRNPDALLDYIDSLIVDSDMYYILLDEIQLVSEFEDVLNSYLSVRNVDIYVTGSNSRFLSKDVITEFRGRGEEIHITPLSFASFIRLTPSWNRIGHFRNTLHTVDCRMCVQNQTSRRKSAICKDCSRKPTLPILKSVTTFGGWR